MRAELKIFERVEQYLLGEMNAADNVQFESELTTNPELAAQLDFQKNLMIGIENVALTASTISAYRKYKVKSLVNKIFLSSVIVAVGFATTLGALTYLDREPVNETKKDAVSEAVDAHFDGDAQHEGTVVVLEETDTAVFEDVVLTGILGDDDFQIIEDIDEGSSTDNNRQIQPENIDEASDQNNGNNNDVAVNNSPNGEDFNGYWPRFETVDKGVSWIGAPPSAFTPDGDGEDDKWCLPVKNLKDFHLKIYENRGKLRTTLFETNDPNDHWDGTNGSLVVPSGKYAYTLTAMGEDGVEHNRKGKLVLERGGTFDKESDVKGLWVEFRNPDGRDWSRVKTTDISAIAEEFKYEDWYLVVPTKNLSQFKFTIYSKKSKSPEDVVYMTYDPDFTWRFKQGDLFQKEGKYYYTIDGIGLDGKKWFMEEMIIWDPPKDKKNRGSSTKKNFGGTYGKDMIVERQVNLASCNSPASAVFKPAKLLTPNGDGKDDVWTVRLENINEMQVKVFSFEGGAKGALVFKTEKIGFEWDGRTDRVLNPPGTYFYELAAEGFDGVVYNEAGTINMRYVRNKGDMDWSN